MYKGVYVPEQTVQPGQDFIFDTSIACPKGYVLHTNGDGILTLRGVTPNPCNQFARYLVGFDFNMAVPTTGTAGEIEATITVQGGERQASKAIITPAATGDYWHVHVEDVVDVFRGCCPAVALENTSTQAVNAQNLSVTVSRDA